MSADEALRRIADRKLNIVTRSEALAAGVTDDQLCHRLAVGVLQRLHPGVYLFGAGRPSFEQRVLAGCRAGGATAVASSRTAAALWRICDGDETIHITVAPTKRPRTKRLVIHRSALEPSERTKLGSIPITTVARTLLDLNDLPAREIERAVDNAIRLRLTTAATLARYLEEKRNVPGSATLRRVVSDRIRNGATERDLETDMIHLLRSFGLPDPMRQQRASVSGRRVRFDLAYPDQGVVIELDGRAPHLGDRDRWQSDHDRHNATELAGVRSFRFTWWDVHERALYVAMTVGAALGLRPVRWTEKRPRGRRE